MRFDISGYFFKLIIKYKRNLSILLFNRIIILFCKIKGVTTAKGIKFYGSPHIRREPYSKIIFGKNNVFNSSKKSVRVGLIRPCKFITMTKDAEIIFGENSGASGTVFAAAKKITIGNNVVIGANSCIIDNDFHETNSEKLSFANKFVGRPVKINDNVFIGFNCMIQKGVTIGANTVIGSNSVVVTNLPENAICMGNPCKVIMRRSQKNKPRA